MLVFFTPSPLRPPRPPTRLGEDVSIGFTAGNGRDGAGDAERRIEGDEPNEDRRLCDTGGGSMGRLEAIGVPGVEGAGEAIAREFAVGCWGRLVISGGAGLLEEIRLAGRSILWIFPCGVNVNWPSLVFKE
jgi:hypothetical protein